MFLVPEWSRQGKGKKKAVEVRVPISKVRIFQSVRLDCLTQSQACIIRLLQMVGTQMDNQFELQFCFTMKVFPNRDLRKSNG